MEDFRRNRLIVGIYVGSRNLSVMVSEVQESGKVSIIFVGSYFAEGFRFGVVVDIVKAMDFVRKTIKRVEVHVKSTIERVYIGLMGRDVKGFNCQLDVILKKGRFETETSNEIIKIIKRNVSRHGKYEVLHIMPYEFVLDGHRGVENPMNMRAKYCQLKAYIIIDNKVHIRNIVKCFHNCGIQVQETVVSVLTESIASLTSVEKDIGTLVLSIGENISYLGIFKKKMLIHFVVIPIGVCHALNDLTINGYLIGNEVAYLKKILYCKEDDLLDVVSRICEVNRIRDDITMELVFKIVCSRLEEIFQIMIQETIQIGLYDMLPGGIVLIGAGSLLDNLKLLITKHSRMKVRIGYPNWDNDVLNQCGGSVYSKLIGLHMRHVSYFEEKNYISFKV